jgi:penicillin-binding protein 1A
MHPVRLIFRGLEWALALPLMLVRVIAQGVIFNPKIGPLRHVFTAAAAYLVFAVTLVYVVAPVRGVVGHYFLGNKLRYDAERWVATAVYDTSGAFVGTFDPRLDSRQDVNFTDKPIETASGYTANPDHKSIPVQKVPEWYWQCLVFHEDRYLGGYLNPYGIDLYGVLKIPYTSIKRTIATKRPTLGVGGSTLPMQFARVIYGTPPSSREGSFTKLGRKMKEWWLAPVIYQELTQGGDITPLKQWAANHIWLAQRTGGQALHGVEVTSRIVFAKDSDALTPAEQFVLASAVNKPIILLSGDEKLNAVRKDRWEYITAVRARACANALITDAATRDAAVAELDRMAGGPPDPKVRPRLQQALDTYAPQMAKRAQANPHIRANVLLPAARFGLREEMKQSFGFGWRDSVRGVTTTLDAVANLAFHDKIKKELAALDAKEQGKFNPGWTLDPAKVGADRKMPHVVVVAANAKGEIVRYYEAGESAAYFGSPFARDAKTGRYDADREARHIASTGKIVSAIAIANEGRDQPGTLYADQNALNGGPQANETCARGQGETPGQRRAVVAFACSHNAPLMTRTAQLGQERVKRLIDGFGFTMPPTDANGERTPPSTAAVLGLMSGSPRRVHHMASVVLAALTEQGHKPVRPPTLVRAYDYIDIKAIEKAEAADAPITPNKMIRAEGHAMLKSLLSAPLCYRHAGQAHGTLKGLSNWCAEGRADLKLHVAKTGTSTTTDADATVDTWTAGGIQFANGAAYSYVVMVGTGSPRDAWARKLHAAQANVPLVEALLNELKEHAKTQRTVAAPAAASQAATSQPSATPAPQRTATATPTATRKTDWRDTVFQRE